jgi:hypothetical protein
VIVPILIGSFISLTPFYFLMVSKQNIIAVILILLGIGLTQIKPNESFAVGLGVGTIAMASLWIVVLIAKDLKKK